VEIRIVCLQITARDEDDVSVFEGSGDQDPSGPVADLRFEVLSLEGSSCALEHCVDFEAFPVY
jgi:hypothetical protein